MYKRKVILNDLYLDDYLHDSLIRLFHAFYFSNKELFLVGGCVRDLLLNKKPKDYDLCTNATPDEVKNILDEIDIDYFDSGIKHGTLTILDKQYNKSYEITTYRIDGKYEDGRHPTEVTFTPSLEEDLKRRDFTINSFAYDFFNCELIMLNESFIRDLEHGIIRTVGNPEKRFNEDALRMLRALRFSAQLNFSIAPETYRAILRLSIKLKYISKERIRDELTKILLSDNPQVLELFAITELERYAFDGLTPIMDMLNCEHENPWHYTDVFHHTMDVVKRVPKTFLLRFSALFHDMGKPSVKCLKEGTIDHYRYIGHQDVSSEIALQLMELLKFSNVDKDLIYKFVKYHDCELVDCKNSKFKKFLVDIGVNNFTDYMKLRVADTSAHKLIKDTKYAIDYIDKLWKKFDKVIIKNEALTVKDLKVNGYDMMNLGLKDKEIGDMLNYLLKRVLEKSNLNTREILMQLAKEKIDKVSN